MTRRRDLRRFLCLYSALLTLGTITHSARIMAQPPSSQESVVQPVSPSGSAPAFQPVEPHVMFGVANGDINRCGFSAYNPPPQPQVAVGRCPSCMVGIDCADHCGGTRSSWKDLHPYNFGPLAQGEYLGPIRIPSNIDYRVRIGDEIRFVYILAREVLSDTFVLRVGDQLQISSVIDENIRLGDIVQGRGAEIQPDGNIYLSLIGPTRAAGLTIPQLRRSLEEAYKTKGGIRNPAIDIIPIKTNTLLEDLRSSVDARAGQGGQAFNATVNPDGTIRLPKLGPVCVQGMTLDEIKREVNLRYRQVVTGLELEPVLQQQAPHFVFVYGEVGTPNRYQMLGPTTVTQALAQAGGVKVGGNNRQIVIFRRAEDWRLIATRIDLRGAHLGKVPSPADEIWLRDNDLIIVPKTPVQRFDDFVQQVFVNGMYGVFPFSQLGSGLTVGVGVFR